ncbi:MAG: DUF1304 domain-containing protein [Lactobacillaceae bacterium]|jgi:putative membrane protein|nr:DUF1304 domain-containing protein [Lactobacillaceae bacterium]
MENIASILIAIVGVEAIGIMLMEMFGSPKLQSKVFEIDQDFLELPNAKSAMINQGAYNGGVGIMILISQFAFREPMVSMMFLIFVFVMAMVGAFTVSKKIILSQGAPALIALIVLAISTVVK